MTLFYEKAIEDAILGPYFIHELGDDMQSEEWVEHIDLLADFWLAKMLGEKTYKGNFIGAHIKLPQISRESFDRWLKLFSLSVDAVYVPEITEVFKKKATLFSQQFINNTLKI
ncbi:group III truncated hemoglobin [Sulfurimonas sp. SWIR-19]|uniref:group III truncated hemoglobin n=1 Tax=Sulfurimonas sp. SWIR-19 TaxID=2878390 RepID=UPI001CF4F7B5|nr:group III truncated hemoglobin [Sulfurimonas sp. SWIR-19]UCN01493.1 group III truncated hemoglobin [Sulfurimonas sp. SWIR-19]